MRNSISHRADRLVIACLLLAVSRAMAAPASTPAHDDACPDAARMEAVERGLDLPGLMKTYRIPAISVAVIDDDRIVCAKAYGVTELGGKTPATPATLFLAGSISKPVAAVGALTLVERGKLSLDGDVNARLKSWKIPDSQYTKDRKVSLGLILDHTAGFTGGDFFPGYAVGEAVPTLLQILDGVSPARNDPIRVGFPPGSAWHYSGDGYLVAQQLMVDAGGKPFPELMRAAVFEKIGMHDSSYEQPLPAARAAYAAAGTRKDGTPVKGKWHVNPEMAAGGLWTTASDLARLAIELALSTQGKANHVLGQPMARDMLAPHWSQGVINILGPKDDPDGMGYGFFVGRKGGRFGHVGGNVGYQATMVMFGETGKGAVILTDSDIGLAAGLPLLNKIARVYGWNYTAPEPP